MATTITKTETLVGKRIRRQRRSAADHRHGHLCGRHQDARHASRLHRAQPARRGEDPRHRHQARARPSRRGGGLHRRRRRQASGRCPCGASLPGLRVPHHAILAQDRVYFVGHPVAVVVATDRYIARRRGGSGRSGLRAAAGGRRSGKGDRARRARRCIRSGRTTSRSPSTRKAATSSKAFADAEVVVKQRITSQRLIPTAMETRGVVAEWRPGEKIADAVLVHADPAPDAHAGRADARACRRTCCA